MAGYAFASLGLEILKQSVLLVLYEARGESIPFLHLRKLENDWIFRQQDGKQKVIILLS